MALFILIHPGSRKIVRRQCKNRAVLTAFQLAEDDLLSPMDGHAFPFHLAGALEAQGYRITLHAVARFEGKLCGLWRCSKTKQQRRVELAD